MLQNARVTAFTVTELRENQQEDGGGDNFTPNPPRLGLKGGNLGLKPVNK